MQQGLLCTKAHVSKHQLQRGFVSPQGHIGNCSASAPANGHSLFWQLLLSRKGRRADTLFQSPREGQWVTSFSFLHLGSNARKICSIPGSKAQFVGLYPRESLLATKIHCPVSCDAISLISCLDLMNDFWRHQETDVMVGPGSRSRCSTIFMKKLPWCHDSM